MKRQNIGEDIQFQENQLRGIGSGLESAAPKSRPILGPSIFRSEKSPAVRHATE